MWPQLLFPLLTHCALSFPTCTYSHCLIRFLSCYTVTDTRYHCRLASTWLLLLVLITPPTQSTYPRSPFKLCTRRFNQISYWLHSAPQGSWKFPNQSPSSSLCELQKLFASYHFWWPRSVFDAWHIKHQITQREEVVKNIFFKVPKLRPGKCCTAMAVICK